MDKEMIEKLKKNTCVYGEMPREECVLLTKLNNNNIKLLYRGIGNWFLVDGRPLSETTTYRIPLDYTPEPEVVRCEVYLDENRIVYDYLGAKGCYVGYAVTWGNFIAYEYADGEITVMPRMLRSNGCCLPITSLGGIVNKPAEYPKFVLFAK